MGQQQLLLIVLGVIIVGIAVIVGINMFTIQYSNANREAVISDLTTIAAQAQQFYKKPAALGGGSNSFVGFTIPANMKRNLNGSYAVTVTAKEITLVGKGTTTLTAGGTDTVQVTMKAGPDKINSTVIDK